MRLLRLRPETLVAIGGLVLIAAVFLTVSAKNPPGFYRDESAIAYNAYTLATTGKDEYGARVPLFIRSFGDYKSPLYVYLLAAVFRVTGPSSAVARGLSAVLGLAAVLVLFALALAISRRPLTALAVALLAGLSPWLFEISRLVFEVALMPLLIALFLLALYRAAAGEWRRRSSIAIGLLLAAMAYTYQLGRVLGPLFAVGLVLFWRRDRLRALVTAWAVYVAALLPIGVYALIHPGALEERYHAVTYIHGGMSWWDIGRQFVEHYGRNMNLWSWLVHGDSNQRHHVPGTGSLFFVEVGLALAGTAIILLRRRSDPWWRFILFAVLVCPVAGSLTDQSVHSLRMIALPVLLPVLALPAFDLIAALPRRRATAVVAVLLVAFAYEAVHWQVIFHRDGPNRLDAFEAQIHPVIEAALRHGGTIYAYRQDHTAYIDSLFYGAVAGRSRSSIVILDSAAPPPPGSLVVGRVGDCPSCRSVAEDGGFEAYLTPS